MHTPSSIASETIAADQHAGLALQIIGDLHRAGYTSYLAGGCVRDALLGKRPKDYDVATEARPEQIREVFGRRRTLAIGAAFGVMCVLPRQRGAAEPVEVATFRRDGNYSDGRRPDQVHFSSPELDAQRRDFTINGLFFDPESGEVYDFVEGLEDLHQRQVRAIGDPVARFAEDRLRLLRAVRFATTYDFRLEAGTLEALVHHADEVTVCSGERIGAEMRRLLCSMHADRGLTLLFESGLADPVLGPVAESLETAEMTERTQHRLRAEPSGAFPPRLALVLTAMGEDWERGLHWLAEHWRLANEEVDAVKTALGDAPALLRADRLRWSQLQPLLVKRHAEVARQVTRAVASGAPQYDAALERLEQARQLPSEQLDPPPLLSGRDLIEMGLQPGPRFKQLLGEIRARQLDGVLVSPAQAREVVRRWVRDDEAE
jgi:tRNA nucleotidyltransferase (CCA-adding enzyme)